MRAASIYAARAGETRGGGKAVATARKGGAGRSRQRLDGDRRITTRGLADGFWHDAYYTAMTARWPAFVGASAVVFCAVNILFAFAYLLAPGAVAGVGEGNLPNAFFFSIETLATVGYGDLHPQTRYGHAVASVEMFVGLFLSALLTGLIFARFSRPRARFLFADVVTLHDHEGQPTLVVRVANARQSTIVNASAKLWLIRDRVSREGVLYRGFEPLALQRAENPTFLLSWSVFHVIDADSPLAGQSGEALAADGASVLLTLTGHDESASQQVHGRQTYAMDRVRWNHRYADIIDIAPDGDVTVDYTRFHEVVDLTRA